MQRGLPDGNAVCPSVCPSITRVYCDKTNEVLPTFLYHMKGKFISFFGHKEWLVEDTSFYLKFWVKLTHPASEMAIFNQY